MNPLQSNAIRSIIIVILGMLVVDVAAWATIDIDWRPTAARYAVAVLAAVLRILSAPVATVKDSSPVV